MLESECSDLIDAAMSKLREALRAADDEDDDALDADKESTTIRLDYAPAIIFTDDSDACTQCNSLFPCAGVSIS